MITYYVEPNWGEGSQTAVLEYKVMAVDNICSYPIFFGTYMKCLEVKYDMYTLTKYLI